MAIIEKEFLEITRDLDVESFWQENEHCGVFTEQKPRCALYFSPDDHWLFGFLNVESTVRYYKDRQYRNRLHKEANAVTLDYVGKAFFDDDSWEFTPRRIEN